MIILVLLKLQKNSVKHLKIKHIDCKYYFIRERVEIGTVELHFVPTGKQLADILTKTLDEATLTRLVSVRNSKIVIIGLQ